MVSSTGRRGAVLLVAALALAGCSSDDPDGPGATPTAGATTSSTPSPSPTPSADDEADEAAVLDAYHAYWDAAVAAQAGDTDPEVFAGVAEGALVEEWIGNSRQLSEVGVTREGRPSFSDVSVELEGDVATVVACVDYSEWVVPGAEGGTPEVLPGGVVLERSDASEHGWVVVARAESTGDLEC